MNNFIVNIKQNDGFVELAATAVFPFRFGELLDERLDEAYVDIINDTTEEYAPLTEFSITATAGGETVTKYYALARDRAETNRLTGKVKHSLYLLERTKKLEGIVCPSLTFTNASAKVYTENVARAFYTDEASSTPTASEIDFPYKTLVPIAVASGEVYNVPTAKAVAESLAEQFAAAYSDLYNDVSATMSANPSGSPSGHNYLTSVTVSQDEDIPQTYYWDDAVSVTPTSFLRLTYTVCISYRANIGENLLSAVYRYYVTPTVVSNRLPLKKWTITDCVNRVLFCAEPLEAADHNNIFTPTPRYTFRDDQAAKYDKVIAPECSMTQCTLREQLKVIGTYIHGEPRLDENDKIYFEDYGITTEANVSGLPCVYKAASWDINDFCTEIRSNAQNLVSALGYADGALIEPAQGWYRSLRSETAYARTDESNGEASTQYLVYEVDSLKCGILGDDVSTYYIEPRETKAYLFESTVYSANLSSYKDTYPYSKSYALYYTQGAKNIKGMFFRADTTGNNAVFSRYAISNILGALDNTRDASEIDRYLQKHPERLVFQITYKPIYPTLISHGKSLYVSGEERHTKVYNQGENLIETQYYGENLKGVVARLGNVERERTFLLSTFSQIPRTGQMIDGYAISAVSVEMMPFSLKCTVGLTKDFNRISEYIGVSSVKRMYEVSERMVYNRDILIHNTALISMNAPTNTYTSLFDSPITTEALYRIFIPTGKTQQPISMAAIYGSNKQHKMLYDYDISLPVIPTALGNAMTFYFAFKDNYSAGSAARYTEANAGVTGYWMDDVRYTDFYGRMYNLHFALYAGANGATLKPSTFTPNPYDLPEAIGLFPGSTDVTDVNYAIVGSYAIRKDSRERISVTAELEFKTDDPSIIVGSGLARYCSLVSNVSDYGVEVYAITDPSVLPTKFDKKFTAESGYVNLSSYLTVEKMSNNRAIEISLTGHTGRTSYGWVICTASNPYTETVEDEDGVETTQTVERGRDILLARINTVEGTSALFPPIYISILNE